eukprot:TRINITY_DN66843_c2_g1_i1.p2 TRINITY_DN66843_c2_g1~~TRINITY_DN66843_c2_g1_i1.p2  ORF type:complete len:135 (+),score=62.74 TRINITY_DN66843_c2_g1_i1:125-529(+)
MDVELLKSMTTYSGYTEKDPQIRFFWEIMRNRFDDAARAKFLRFVWGRSRLPVRAADFERQFRINKMSRPQPDRYLPIGHTCFFSFDLCEYSEMSIMEERLRYAANHCSSIDADFSGAVFTVDDDDGDSDSDED